jgi:hypothetical protein
LKVAWLQQQRNSTPGLNEPMRRVPRAMARVSSSIGFGRAA